VARAGLLDLADRFKRDGRLLFLLAVADVAGIVGGWYYYADVGQFDLRHLLCGPGAEAYCTPVWAWPLVGDSPNAVLVIFVALLAYRLGGWRHKALDALAFTLNVYVGLWTTALFVSYASTMGTYAGGTNTFLFVTHMGMPLQSLVLAKDMRRDTWGRAGVAAVLAFLALFVAVDYWGPHWHPAPQVDASRDDLFGWGGDLLLRRESVALMAASAAAWLAICRPLRARGAPETA
jgi:uncharacterized membrane protein YpjA